MIPWIQVYSNILTHDKTYKLSEALKIPNYSAVGLMVSLWCWASVNATDGDITNYPPRAISEATGWTKKPNEFYKVLLDTNLIEKTEDGKVMIRNWEQYAILLIDLMDSQKKKTNERVKKHRERKRQKEKEDETPHGEQPPDCNTDGDAPCNVTVTQSNALHNLTLPNPTLPNLSPNGERKKIFVVDDGSAGASAVEEIVGDFLENRDLTIDRYFGMSETVKAEAVNITDQIFNRLALRNPTEQDVSRVFFYCHKSEQTAPGDWTITYPKNSIELLLYAFEQATLAGCAGNWNYITGVMSKLAQRGIKTLADAEDYDFSREGGL